MIRGVSKGQRMREWQKIMINGDDSSRGQNKLSDVAPTPQGTWGGGEEDNMDNWCEMPP